MARFTSDSAEIQHLKDIDQQLVTVASQNGGRVQITLVNGQVIVGDLSGTSIGNNAGRRGRWAYYGDVTIIDDNGHVNIIDRLDIIKVETP